VSGESPAFQTAPCIAIVADLVASRSLGNRSQAQAALEGLLQYLNRTYGKHLLAAFTISAGDDFQAILTRADPLVDIIWDARSRFSITGLRFGIGRGVLTTPIRRAPTETDGPAWWSAREAVRAAADGTGGGTVFNGFDQDDVVLTGFGALLAHLQDGFTARQRDVLERLRAGNDYVTIASELGITKQGVFAHARSLGWNAYRLGEAGWRAVLGRFDYSDEWRPT
jgi:hypothetical protein